MPLDLHDALKLNLRDKLVEKLGELRVIRGVGLATASMEALAELDKSLPNHGPVREKLETWISDQPFSDFVASEINFDLQKIAWSGAEDVPLGDIESYSNRTRRTMNC